MSFEKSSIIMPGGTIGIIGGGQLGRMTALAAANLGYKVHIYEPEKHTPAKHVAAFATDAPYDDRDALKDFASLVDVISFEFENIPDSTIAFLEEIANVRPGAKSLHISQNRIREKTFFSDVGIDTANYAKITSCYEFEKAFQSFENKKAILKTLELGYDGKGQVVVEDGDNLSDIYENSNISIGVLEEFVDFSKEISVIIAKSANGEIKAFPVAENVHKNGILDTSTVPANINKDVESRAKNIAIHIAENLDLTGLLAVEFFITKDDKLLVNEMAPRPHNSGHWSMDGCVTSQFEQFVRAICGLPLGNVDITHNVMMKNLLGKDIDDWQNILKESNAKLHLYGKKEARDGRKMGHINYINAHNLSKYNSFFAI